MTRFSCLVVLMVLASSAHADGFSFVVGGHRIRIDAPRDCGSPSCVSVFIPGIYETRRRHERNEDVDAASAKSPAPAPAPQLASLPSAVAPPGQPPVEPKVAAPPSPPASEAPPAPAPKQAAAPSPPPAPIEPVTPPVTPAPTPAADVVAPAAPAAPQVLKVSREADEPPAETPLGDWRTEGDKRSVRIEQCGRALCGYALDPASNMMGESVLINMKPKATDLWSGDIYSRASGATYYATVAMKGTNSLRVEACALGRFFCSANLWSRIVAKPRELITSSRTSPEPRS
ncbi:MAG: DUF2147 domain-containing protein [Bradyrhizobium sp.]